MDKRLKGENVGFEAYIFLTAETHERMYKRTEMPQHLFDEIGCCSPAHLKAMPNAIAVEKAGQCC